MEKYPAGPPQPGPEASTQGTFLEQLGLPEADTAESANRGDGLAWRVGHTVERPPQRTGTCEGPAETGSLTSYVS